LIDLPLSDGEWVEWLWHASAPIFFLDIWVVGKAEGLQALL
jgi:hypothetical protein